MFSSETSQTCDECITEDADDVRYVRLPSTQRSTDATICRYFFTAKLLYMFRVSQHSSSGVLKTVTAASGTGLNISTATSRSGHAGG